MTAQYSQVCLSKKSDSPRDPKQEAWILKSCHFHATVSNGLNSQILPFFTLLYQMAHLGGWELPNLLSLGASSKVWFQNGEFQRWHPMISVLSRGSSLPGWGGGRFSITIKRIMEWTQLRMRQDEDLRIWVYPLSPEIMSGCPDWSAEPPVAVAGGQYHLLAAKNALHAAGG